MNDYACELWKSARVIRQKLDSVSEKPKEEIQEELCALFTTHSPLVEDVEYALHTAVISRLESGDIEKVKEIAGILDIVVAIIIDQFDRASKAPPTPSDTDTCKSWWSLFFTNAEDVARLIPTSLIGQLVDHWEVSLVQLKDAYLRLAKQRLQESDVKEDGPARQDERKKLISHLGISPNGLLYLTLTSLLKQLNSRLCSSLHASLRARCVFLLERILAMDHKAIANNQKLRTQDFITCSDLDEDVMVGGDFRREFYRDFWSLQEALQYPDRMLEDVFLSTLTKVITYFLEHPAHMAAQPWAPPDSTPLRYAPRSRALGVQLNDPEFRLQFLTQVLIAFQVLEQEVRRTDPAPLSQKPESIRAEFASLKKQCQKVMVETRPAFAKMLTQVLERETQWVGWKGHGCREFEHESKEMLTARVTQAAKLSPEPRTNRKPHLEPYVSSLLKTLKDPQWKEPSVRAPMCERYLDRLIEEEKPENGIEEEYKAKKNKVFMWQCRRLFCQQHLRVYAQKDVRNPLDFMDAVKYVRTGKAPSKTEAEAEVEAEPADVPEAEEVERHEPEPQEALEAQEVQEAVEMAEVVEAEDPQEEPNGGDQVQSSKDTEAAPDGPSPASDLATECLKREGESDGSEPPAKKLKQ